MNGMPRKDPGRREDPKKKTPESGENWSPKSEVKRPQEEEFKFEEKTSQTGITPGTRRS